MYFEFKLKNDYKSPNAVEQNGKLVWKVFKQGETFVGKSINGTNRSAGFKSPVYMDKDNWLIPDSLLEKKSDQKFNSYEDYLKSKKTFKTEDLPEEIKVKIRQVAENSYAKSITGNIGKNLKRSMLFGIAGMGYSFFAKKNIYLWGIAGFLVGIIYTGISANPSDEKLLAKKKAEEKEPEKAV